MQDLLQISLAAYYVVTCGYTLFTQSLRSHLAFTRRLLHGSLPRTTSGARALL